MFAIDVTSPPEGYTAAGSRTVDLWVGGAWLSCDDNHAHVPHVCGEMEHLILRLLRDAGPGIDLPLPAGTGAANHRHVLGSGLEGPHGIFRWGPTTDNHASFVFRRGQNLIVTAEFLRPDHPRPAELGKVFSGEMPEREFLEILVRALGDLRQGEREALWQQLAEYRAGTWPRD